MALVFLYAPVLLPRYVHRSLAVVCPGVLAGAIDYYIIAKINNLRNDAVYVKVCSSEPLDAVDTVTCHSLWAFAVLLSTSQASMCHIMPMIVMPSCTSAVQYSV